MVHSLDARVGVSIPCSKCSIRVKGFRARVLFPQIEDKE